MDNLDIGLCDLLSFWFISKLTIVYFVIKNVHHLKYFFTIFCPFFRRSESDAHAILLFNLIFTKIKTPFNFLVKKIYL